MNLINRRQVRRFILAKYERLRPGHKITAVSKEALDKIESQMRVKIIAAIRSHPTIGKTFKF